jgi:hypothetical protein
VDGVYNRNLRQPQNERLTENSKKTVEILSTFFTLSLPDTMKQNPVLKMRFLQLYYETGLALLAEFRSFLWEHDQIARNFLQQAIPGFQEKKANLIRTEHRSVVITNNICDFFRSFRFVRCNGSNLLTSDFVKRIHQKLRVNNRR